MDKFNQVKIVITVPQTHTDVVRKALGDAGAGKIGNYSHCSSTEKSVGRFLPLAGAHPAIGQVGKFEEVVEDRIECTCDKAITKEVIAAVRKVHPYEKPTFDIYPLLSEGKL